MRWGIIPYWRSKPLKKMSMATFQKRRCLMPVSGVSSVGRGARSTSSPSSLLWSLDDLIKGSRAKSE